MKIFREGNLEFDFSKSLSARKFDNNSHGLSHCMKSVDFVVETQDKIILLEVKASGSNKLSMENNRVFVNEFKQGNKDEIFKTKFRDTFIYLWAEGSLTSKQICYYVLLDFENLTLADLGPKMNSLGRILPLDGPKSGRWKRRIVNECLVFNFDSWNRYISEFPLKRVS